MFFYMHNFLFDQKFRQSVDKILVERFMKSDFYLIRWLRRKILNTI